MKPEYRYLLILAVWIALWTFFPLGAFFAFVFMSCRHFYLLRKNRKIQQAAEPYRKFDQQWLKMEGFEQEPQADPADWWKK